MIDVVTVVSQEIKTVVCVMYWRPMMVCVVGTVIVAVVLLCTVKVVGMVVLVV